MGRNNPQSWCEICHQNLIRVRTLLGRQTSGQHPDGRIAGREECLNVAQTCYMHVDDACGDLHRRTARELVTKSTEQAIHALRWAREQWALGNATCTPASIAQEYQSLASELEDFLRYFHLSDRESAKRALTARPAKPATP